MSVLSRDALSLVLGYVDSDREAGFLILWWTPEELPEGVYPDVYLCSVEQAAVNMRRVNESCARLGSGGWLAQTVQLVEAALVARREESVCLPAPTGLDRLHLHALAARLGLFSRRAGFTRHYDKRFKYWKWGCTKGCRCTGCTVYEGYGEERREAPMTYMDRVEVSLSPLPLTKRNLSQRRRSGQTPKQRATALCRHPPVSAALGVEPNPGPSKEATPPPVGLPSPVPLAQG